MRPADPLPVVPKAAPAVRHTESLHVDICQISGINNIIAVQVLRLAIRRQSFKVIGLSMSPTRHGSRSSLIFSPER
jgi:hypothetical protein